MSWDISLTDRVTGEVLHSDSPHMMRGGTFMLGGTTELWLNITYNYGKIYRRDSVFGKDGIGTIFGIISVIYGVAHNLFIISL